mmetsp:Transcript_19468/g.45657  ORF Transcript_19468/g.45657 Transcript_19468/m.45657 type:complete len:85 (+) Transcript_19468:982-1236(+)
MDHDMLDQLLKLRLQTKLNFQMKCCRTSRELQSHQYRLVQSHQKVNIILPEVEFPEAEEVYPNSTPVIVLLTACIVPLVAYWLI